MNFYLGRFKPTLALTRRYLMSNSSSSFQLTTKINTKLENIDFENTSLAFKSKNNSQLLKTYFVFQLCSINYLVNNQMKVINFICL